MKTIPKILAAILVLFAGITLAEERVVSLRTIAPAQSLEPGKTAILTIELEIPHPYHIQSNAPLQDYLIPTSVEIEPQPGVTFGKAVFPAAPVKKLAASDSPMAVFEGVVKIQVEVTPGPDFQSNEIKVAGRVRYQTCDETTCFPPVGQAFGIALPVTAGLRAGDLPAAKDAVARSLAPGASSSKTVESGTAVDFGNRSLLVTFALVFLGGLALNLTPCVYPMIPITITYFGGQAQGKKGSILAHSGLYVIGMAVTYSILGVVAALTGGFFGAALQFPPVLIGIALVMVALALSMFDVYELRMPQFLNRLAGGSQKGFFGTLLMGLTVGIVAAPCIGPFVLGLLTYVGNRGSAVLGFALFFVLALGLGVPFLILGAFSGSIHKLPRSGAWMIWVRKIFGFVMLAMAVYFLKAVFPTPLAYHLTLTLIMLLAGIYLAWIDTVPGSGQRFVYVRNFVGILFFAAALYTAVYGLEGRIESMQARSSGTNSVASVQWIPYSDEMLRRAAEEGKPVFINFHAEWCAPCKELDERTFSTPEVAGRSKEFIMLTADLTSADDPKIEALRKKYQTRGVPTLVFLTPDGQEIAGLRGTGFETKEIFLEKMDKALSAVGKTKPKL